MNKKQKQWIGDAVFTLLVREYLAQRYPAQPNTFDHSRTTDKYNKMCCNNTMGKLAVEFGVLQQHQLRDLLKDGGDEFEEYVYELYSQNGLAWMEAWFIFEVMPAMEKIKGKKYFEK